MIGSAKALGIAGKIGLVTSSMAALVLAMTLLVLQIRGIYNDGAEARDAFWKAEIATKNLEAVDNLADARAAGRAEGLTAARAAEQRAAGAEAALRRARQDDPEFDQVLNAQWPDGFFISVCDGRPDCLPPN
jgi:hypothetical protein